MSSTPLTNEMLMILFWLILARCNALETITNPGQYSSVTCGINEDCWIICTTSCEYSTFNIYNNNIYIACADCEQVTIISSNTSFINLNFTGSYSFRYGKYISDSLDQGIINVTCGGGYACAFATFKYGINQTANHICSDTYCCWGNIIYALGTVSIDCEGGKSGSYICTAITVFSQTNNLEFTILGPTYATYYTQIDDPIVVYVPESQYIPQWNCIGGGCNYQYITYVPGIEFDIDSSCLASDESCINTMITTLDNDNKILINVNTKDIDFSNYQHDAINDVIMILSNPEPCSTFISPIIDLSYTLSLFCIGCDEITFDLSLTQNVILTNPNSDHLSGSIANSIVYGPINYFKFNAYSYDDLWGDYHDRYNTYYLNNTQIIDILNIGFHSQIYLGSSTNVSIKCNSDATCNYLNIYSSLNPSHLQSGDYTFYCADFGGCCNPPICTEFYIDFAGIGQRCNYTKYRFNTDLQSICTSLTSTSIPALNILPTCTPTATTNPSATPTLFPSASSVNPTSLPTVSPSKNPTSLPTMFPSKNPTISHNPSKSPSYIPTQNPTDTAMGVITTNTDTTTTMNNGGQLPANNDSSNQQILDKDVQYILVYGLIIVLILVIIAITICCVVCLRQKGKSQKIENQTVSNNPKGFEGNNVNTVTTNNINQTFPPIINEINHINTDLELQNVNLQNVQQNINNENYVMLPPQSPIAEGVYPNNNININNINNTPGVINQHPSLHPHESDEMYQPQTTPNFQQ